ncbi:sugar kinase [uncultured Nitratireductor sp.]|uniref:sugar kinase n=1 Tax=uncultured Nitratireductor sp. TaxID=520953 RepID=UPI00261F2E91|nr:sugar kinase [uncultured Nitratireductor sp.]
MNDNAPKRVACIGECLIELSNVQFADRTSLIGIAGDTLNTAVHLSRLFPQDRFEISYLTVLGQDNLSAQMVDFMASEGLNVDQVGRHPARLPGIYAIETRPDGERSFQYWRERSAARTLFQGAGPSLNDLENYDLIYLSGITLAILPENIRNDLIARCGELKSRGATIVFDPNYRPALWRDPATARQTFEAVWKVVSIGLPSYDDEICLWAALCPQEVADRISAFGVEEVAVKNGAKGPTLSSQKTIDKNDFGPADKVVDTTGAGDAFNAGYLATRLGGGDQLEAAAAGHEFAKRLVGVPGAIPV